MLSQITTEVEILQKHITCEEPDLEFIITHAESLLQLAFQMKEQPFDRPIFHLEIERPAC